MLPHVRGYADVPTTESRLGVIAAARAGLHQRAPDQRTSHHLAPSTRGASTMLAIRLHPHARDCTVAPSDNVRLNCRAGLHRPVVSIALTCSRARDCSSRRRYRFEVTHVATRTRGATPPVSSTMGGLYDPRPHARDCTCYCGIAIRVHSRAPACAGLHRSAARIGRPSLTCSRTRGATPAMFERVYGHSDLLPHARGYTGEQRTEAPATISLPARAGLLRGTAVTSTLAIRLHPHARGFYDRHCCSCTRTHGATPLRSTIRKSSRALLPHARDCTCCCGIAIRGHSRAPA